MDWRAKHTRPHQVIKNLGCIEVGEAIVTGLAVAFDLGPVDVDVRDLANPERSMHGRERLAMNDRLEEIAVEHGVVERRVPEPERSRLPDHQWASVGG